MSTVKPVLTEYELGQTGWRLLHDLANQRGRRPEKQAVQLIRFALSEAIAGKDVELSQSRLDALLGSEAAA